jgi:hypothetical protein
MRRKAERRHRGLTVLVAVGFISTSCAAVNDVATRPDPPPPKPPEGDALRYTTTWLGNTTADGELHVQQSFDDIEVADDGTVYSNVIWDEGGAQVSQFAPDGELTTMAGHTFGWGQLGGKAVAANDDYLFFAQSFSNEDNGLVDPTTWPPRDTDWQGISRRSRADITAAVPFEGAKGGAGDTLAGSFLPIHEVPVAKVDGETDPEADPDTEADKAAITGLAADARHLYVADPYTSSLLVFDPESMSRTATWPSLPRLGHLALDGGGNIWAVQHAGDGAPPRVLGISPEGAVFATVELAAAAKPVDVAIDTKGMLFVADNGPDQNVKVYDTSALAGSPTTVQSTFGSSLVAGPVEARGVVGLGPRFLGLTGVGVTGDGDIVVSSSFGANRGVLERFSPAGEQRWAQYGLPFLDMVAVDPASDADIYSADLRYSFDWSKKEPGSEWSLEAVTLDPASNPADSRAMGNEQPVLRRLNDGKLYMFTSDMYSSNITVYRFDSASYGESAVVAAFISKDDKIGRDVDANGVFDESEIKTAGDPRDHGDATWGFWVDDRGDVWQTVNADETADAELRRYRLQGFDDNGAPVYGFDAVDSYPVPAPFTTDVNEGLERVLYDSGSDTMYLAGYTLDSPSDTWGSFRVVARYDRWSTGNRTATWAKELPYDVEEGQVPIAMDVAGDFFFVGGVQTRSEISVYKTSDGSPVGKLVPNNGRFEVEDTGWIDVRPFGIAAIKRSNGEYAVFVEDDEGIRTVVYRWTP